MNNSALKKGSIKTTLLVLFAIFTAIILGMALVFFWMGNRFSEVNEIHEKLSAISINYSEANSQQKDFLLFETISPTFFDSGESATLLLHEKYYGKATEALYQLKSDHSISPSLSRQIDSLQTDLNAWKSSFIQIVELTRKKGFKDWGVVGEMREHIHHLENSPLNLPLSDVLMIRRHEKDYLLRKQVQYPRKLAEAVDALEAKVLKMPESKDKSQALANLRGYRNAFQKLVALEETIGYKRDSGLKARLFKLTNLIDQDLQRMEESVAALTKTMRQRLTIVTVILIVSFILVVVLSSIYINKKLGRRIARLSENIQQVIESDFQSPFLWKTRAQESDEITQIGRDVSLMYHRVQSYTSELMQQKEEVMMQAENLKGLNTQLEEHSERVASQKNSLEEHKNQIAKQHEELEQNYYNLQMLSLIGQQILSKLDRESIVREVYKHVESMMGEQTFAFGIYHTGEEQLRFMVLGEKGELQEYPIPFTKNHLGIYSFVNMEEIVIAHADEEYIDYISERPDAEKDPRPQSYLYIPLHTKQGKMGVLTVKSLQKAAYSSFQVNIFRNIATYTSIALENANIYGRLSTQQEELEAQTQMLSVQTDALIEANEKVREKNQAIMSSINYAQRMQEAILPRFEQIQQYIPQFFVLYQPRDIVSGDFYFFHANETAEGEEHLTLVAADCTGHGVPGAFTSVVGNGLLNTVVQRNETQPPHQILSELNEGVFKTFRQEENENREGMDMSLVTIEPAKKKLYYAGAKSPLIYVQDGQLHYLRGDRYSVGGGIKISGGGRYSTHEIDISKPTTCYLFSDGYQDQFGGPKQRKLTSKRMRALLHEAHHLPMPEQKQKLASFIKNWMEEGGESQIDDILVMGFRVGGE